MDEPQRELMEFASNLSQSDIDPVVHDTLLSKIRDLPACDAMREALEIARKVHRDAKGLSEGRTEADPERLRWLYHSYGADEVASKIDDAINSAACEMRRMCADMKHCYGPSHAELKERFALQAPAAIRHPVEKLWREAGLPEWFLGNDGTNTKLYALYDAILALQPGAGERDICPYCDSEMDENACSTCGRERVPAEGYGRQAPHGR